MKDASLLLLLTTGRCSQGSNGIHGELLGRQSVLLWAKKGTQPQAAVHRAVSIHETPRARVVEAEHAFGLIHAIDSILALHRNVFQWWTRYGRWLEESVV